MEVVLDKWFVLERNGKLTSFGYLLFLLILFTCLSTLLYPFIENNYGISFSCLFHSITGKPCPTCGYTRAFKSVFVGDFRNSFLFNPFWIVLIFYQLSLIGYSIKSIWLSRYFLFKDVWVKIFVGLMLINWVLKFTIGENYY